MSAKRLHVLAQARGPEGSERVEAVEQKKNQVAYVKCEWSMNSEIFVFLTFYLGERSVRASWPTYRASVSCSFC